MKEALGFRFSISIILHKSLLGKLLNKLINKKMDTVLYSLILYTTSTYLYSEVKEEMNTRNCYGEFEHEKANCKKCCWKKICDFYNER